MNISVQVKNTPGLVFKNKKVIDDEDVSAHINPSKTKAKHKINKNKSVTDVGNSEKERKDGERNEKLENSIEVVAFDLLKKAEQAFFDFDFESAERYLSVSQHLKSDEYTNEIIAMVEKAKHDLIKDEVTELKKKLFRNANKTNENVFDVSKMGNAFWTPIPGNVQFLLAKIEDYYPDTRAKELFRKIGRASDNLRDIPVPTNLINKEKDLMSEARKAIYNFKYERAECLLRICVSLNPASEAKALLNDVINRSKNGPNKEEYIKRLEMVEKAINSKDFPTAKTTVSICEGMTNDPILFKAIKLLKNEIRKAENTARDILTAQNKANMISKDVDRAKHLLYSKNFTLAQSIVAKYECKSKTDALLKTALELIKREATTTSADKYLQIAKEAVGNENFAQAEACLEAIVKYHPDDAKRLSRVIKCVQKELKTKRENKITRDALKPEFSTNLKQAGTEVLEGNFKNALLYLEKCKDFDETGDVVLQIERIGLVLRSRRNSFWDMLKMSFKSVRNWQRENMAIQNISIAEKNLVFGHLEQASLQLAAAEKVYPTKRAKMLLQYIEISQDNDST